MTCADYIFYDRSGNVVLQDDLQDKEFWCAEGQQKEYSFIHKFGRRLRLRIHPNKEHDAFGPDLLHEPSKRPADLKTQNTPFFASRSLYRIDPQYAVTLNKKDVDRYRAKYPDILIYFAVEWVVVKMVYTSGKVSRVEPMFGVWAIRFSDLCELVRHAPLHKYRQRTNDQRGNATESYVLSLRDLKQVVLECDVLAESW